MRSIGCQVGFFSFFMRVFSFSPEQEEKPKIIRRIDEMVFTRVFRIVGVQVPFELLDFLT